ncbi:MAG: DinB family protein [Chthonomonas sp.]|nr:DinB family protein [Chthonomonas sp.]
MHPLQLLIQAMDTAHWELGEAFKGMPNADLWRRPHPNLWSVGEIASHIAYGEDHNIAGGKVGGRFAEAHQRYYQGPLDEPLVLPMTASEVYEEVKRVHRAVMAEFAAMNPDPEAINPTRPDWTWRQTLEYMAFHVAYHTGQIYSARHIMGHETEDN